MSAAMLGAMSATDRPTACQMLRFLRSLGPREGDTSGGVGDGCVGMVLLWLAGSPPPCKACRCPRPAAVHHDDRRLPRVTPWARWAGGAPEVTPRRGRSRSVRP